MHYSHSCHTCLYSWKQLVQVTRYTRCHKWWMCVNKTTVFTQHKQIAAQAEDRQIGRQADSQMSHRQTTDRQTDREVLHTCTSTQFVPQVQCSQGFHRMFALFCQLSCLLYTCQSLQFWYVPQRLTSRCPASSLCKTIQLERHAVKYQSGTLTGQDQFNNQLHLPVPAHLSCTTQKSPTASIFNRLI